MPYNCVKIKEPPNCPNCNHPLDLPRTKEKDKDRRRYILQSKRIDQEDNAGFWYELSDVSHGEADAPCKRCKNLVEFDIEFGTLINARMRS